MMWGGERGIAGKPLVPDWEGYGRPRIRVRAVDGFLVVDLVDAPILFGEDDVKEIGVHLSRLVEEGHTRLLLNLGEDRYLSGTMVGMLVGLHVRVQRARGRLRLCGIGPLIRDTLRICHVEHLFEICSDESDGLCQGPATGDRTQREEFGSQPGRRAEASA
jgi:anti-sigma B factor antagonist